MKDLKLNLSTEEEHSQKGIAGHTDYAMIIAEAYEDKLFLDDKHLWLAGPNRIWKQHSDKALHGIVRDYLHARFAPTKFRQMNGQLLVENVGPCAKYIKTHGFLTSVVEEV